MRLTIGLVLLSALTWGQSSRALFDGKDLKGWHKNPAKIGHGTGGSWKVEKGVIVGEQDPPGSGNGGILLTDEKFGNFEVTLDVWPDWGVDSGLFLRSTETGKCYQVMIDYHVDGNVGEIYREGLDAKTNRSFTLKTETMAEGKPDWNKVWKPNTWNTLRARVEGNPPTITTWINSKPITRYVSEKKFEGVLGDTGHIAVQVHGGKKAWGEGKKIRFRKIRIKTL